ncbi:tRNA pseudouridine synthase [Cyclospora cayetanensis]|uniref:tRNA pseudouridine synthase n=1 Tax=Cyclospora cayetanensis TaxID=88456 RepID=A0A1D3D3V4_9EIME|nr:tRNA pseudouridine synthase [Cyclospora cayetanensis]
MHHCGLSGEGTSNSTKSSSGGWPKVALKIPREMLCNPLLDEEDAHPAVQQEPSAVPLSGAAGEEPPTVENECLSAPSKLPFCNGKKAAACATETLRHNPLHDSDGVPFKNGSSSSSSRHGSRSDAAANGVPTNERGGHLEGFGPAKEKRSADGAGSHREPQRKRSRGTTDPGFSAFKSSFKWTEILQRPMPHQRLQWTRAARTDKGVHAASNAVALRLSLGPVAFGREEQQQKAQRDPEQEAQGEGERRQDEQRRDEQQPGKCLAEQQLLDASDEECQSLSLGVACPADREAVAAWQQQRVAALLQRLNKELPLDIRCFDIRPVTKNFDARVSCSRRVYEYVLPLWLIQPVAIRADLKARHTQCMQAEKATAAAPVDGPTCAGLEDSAADIPRGVLVQEAAEIPAEAPPASSELPPQCIALYRDIPAKVAPEDLIDRLGKVMRLYEGTHCYRNFTRKSKNKDKNPAAFKRHIHSATRSTLQQVKLGKLPGNEEPVAIVRLEGQSFLYNQIRKMMGLAIEICRGTAPVSAIRFATSRAAAFLHTAPAEGLLLLQPCYDAYNNGRARLAELPAVEFDSIAETIAAFKDSTIYPSVAHTLNTPMYVKLFRVAVLASVYSPQKEEAEQHSMCRLMPR